MNDMENKELLKFDVDKVRGVLANALSLQDKALALEKEIGTEPIYAMIAMGQSVASIASSLSLTIFEMNYILRRTPDHRKQYLNALAFDLADQSSNTLKHFVDKTEMEQEENSAAKHHSGMLDRSLKILNLPSNENVGNQVVVNNTVVIRGTDEIPALPDELKDVIEAEYVST